MELDLNNLSYEQIKELREKLAEKSKEIYSVKRKEILREKLRSPEFIAKRDASIRKRALLLKYTDQIRESLAALCNEHREAIPTANGAAYVRALALLAETA